MGLRQITSLKTKENTINSLCIFHQNIRGLKHKMDELICMLHSCDLSPHIICLTKYYLKEHNLIMMKPNNYYFASKFESQSHTGGGVYIYFKTNHQTKC